MTSSTVGECVPQSPLPFEDEIHSLLNVQAPPPAFFWQEPGLQGDGSGPSQSGIVKRKGPLQSLYISQERLEGWRRAIVEARQSRRQVAMEIHAQFGIPISTAENWFKMSAADGLSDTGRRVFYPELRMSAYELSADQLRSVAKRYKNGISVSAALTAIGLPYVAHRTVEGFLAKNEDDGLNDRGRSLVQRKQAMSSQRLARDDS